MALGEQYDEKRKFTARKSSLVPSGSKDELLVADCIEWGLGYTVTHHILNTQRQEDGRRPVGRDTVWRTVRRLNPCVTPTPTVSQGTTDSQAAFSATRMETYVLTGS